MTTRTHLMTHQLPRAGRSAAAQRHCPPGEQQDRGNPPGVFGDPSRSRRAHPHSPPQRCCTFYTVGLELLLFSLAGDTHEGAERPGMRQTTQHNSCAPGNSLRGESKLQFPAQLGATDKCYCSYSIRIGEGDWGKCQNAKALLPGVLLFAPLPSSASWSSI